MAKGQRWKIESVVGRLRAMLYNQLARIQVCPPISRSPLSHLPSLPPQCNLKQLLDDGFFHADPHSVPYPPFLPRRPPQKRRKDARGSPRLCC